MNLWNATGHRTTSEAQDVVTTRARRGDATSPWPPGDLDLDLRDVMLDLDPGMLAWTPPRTRLDREGGVERAIADAPRRTN